MTRLLDSLRHWLSERRTAAMGWQHFRIDGYFSVDIPAGTLVEHEDDDTMIVFTLPGVPPTQLIAGVFPIPSGKPLDRPELRSEIERFMTDCVRIGHATYVIPVDIDDPQILAYQAVGFSSPDHMGLVRLLGRDGGDQMMLIHWNGPPNRAKKTPISSMVSLELLFP